MGKFWQGKIMANHAEKTIGKENFGEYATVSAYPKCICEYWREKVWQIAHNSPNSIFPYQKFSMYGIPTHFK